MFNLIWNDMRRKAEWYGRPSTTASVLRMVLSEGSMTQIIYRMMQFCTQCRLAPIAFILYRLNAFFGQTVVGRSAEIGPGLIILHSSGIVINSAVRAGMNLTLENGVTIGAEKNKRPRVGDNVFIGAGAKVIGDICIGSDVKIGANAVVVHDLPDGATAVGIPARVVRIYGERVASIEAVVNERYREQLCPSRLLRQKHLRPFDMIVQQHILPRHGLLHLTNELATV